VRDICRLEQAENIAGSYDPLFMSYWKEIDLGGSSYSISGPIIGQPSETWVNNRSMLQRSATIPIPANHGRSRESWPGPE
jgi:hypothetical protein